MRKIVVKKASSQNFAYSSLPERE
jgi:hypothetical protein